MALRFQESEPGLGGEGPSGGEGAPHHDFQGPPNFKLPVSICTSTVTFTTPVSPVFTWKLNDPEGPPSGWAPHWELWPRYHHSHSGLPALCQCPAKHFMRTLVTGCQSCHYLRGRGCPACTDMESKRLGRIPSRTHVHTTANGDAALRLLCLTLGSPVPTSCA